MLFLKPASTSCGSLNTNQKIEDELAEKLLLISDLKDILIKPERVTTIVADGQVRDKFGRCSSTRIQPGV